MEKEEGIKNGIHKRRQDSEETKICRSVKCGDPTLITPKLAIGHAMSQLNQLPTFLK
jgi:hypothetical protein